MIFGTVHGTWALLLRNHAYNVPAWDEALEGLITRHHHADEMYYVLWREKNWSTTGTGGTFENFEPIPYDNLPPNLVRLWTKYEPGDIVNGVSSVYSDLDSLVKNTYGETYLRINEAIHAHNHSMYRVQKLYHTYNSSGFRWGDWLTVYYKNISGRLLVQDMTDYEIAIITEANLKL